MGYPLPVGNLFLLPTWPLDSFCIAVNLTGDSSRLVETCPAFRVSGLGHFVFGLWFAMIVLKRC